MSCLDYESSQCGTLKADRENLHDLCHLKRRHSFTKSAQLLINCYCWIDIHAAHITIHPLKNFRVHHLAPQGWYVGQQEHAEITTRQLGHIIEMT